VGAPRNNPLNREFVDAPAGDDPIYSNAGKITSAHLIATVASTRGCNGTLCIIDGEARIDHASIHINWHCSSENRLFEDLFLWQL
jgi:hypothetical protein